MLKRTFIACMILATSSRSVLAGAPYVGGGVGIVTSGYSPGYAANVFAGYGGLVDQKGRFYLGGEAGADLVLQRYNDYVLYENSGGQQFFASHYNYHANYGVSLSFMPGIMLTHDTMLYGRLGARIPVARPNYFLSSNTVLGLGVQTKIKNNWNIRAEVVHQNGLARNQFNFGLVYNFN